MPANQKYMQLILKLHRQVVLSLIKKNSNDETNLSSVSVEHEDEMFLSTSHADMSPISKSDESNDIFTFRQEHNEEISSIDFLKTLALQYNITHSALSGLLKWLHTNPNLENVPGDARRLLKTPSQNCLSKMGQGYFYYFGLRSGILKVFDKYNDRNKNYSLDFNIDGLPIHKSTRESFWLILCKIVEYPNETPFPVAIYSGPIKPPFSNIP